VRIGVEQATIGRYETARSKAMRSLELQMQLVRALGFARADLIQAARDETAQRPISLDSPVLPGPAGGVSFHIPTPVRVTIRDDSYGLYEAEEGDAPTAVDIAALLDNPALRSLRLVTDDIAPFAETGAFVVYDLDGIPRKGQFCMVRLKSGAYVPRKFLRRDEDGFVLARLVPAEVGGMTAYAEKVQTLPPCDIAGLYPIRLHGD